MFTYSLYAVGFFSEKTIVLIQFNTYISIKLDTKLELIFSKM